MRLVLIHHHFTKPNRCLTEVIDIHHPDYVKCGPEIAQHLLMQAEQGDIESAYKLALMYDTGDRIPENRKEAIRWMQKAEQANLPDAQYVIAVWSERGYFGKDGADLTVPLYEAAANQGHLNAMKSLANIYRDTNPQQYNYWLW